jgi:hypothetical protein
MHRYPGVMLAVAGALLSARSEPGARSAAQAGAHWGRADERLPLISKVSMSPAG